MRLDKGGLRLFRLFGIDVFVHWSWGLVAVIELQTRTNAYSSQAWNIAEYLLLFVIVLMHEFGHALACRSVGGTAERILLWPLGGVAFVAPRRAGLACPSCSAAPPIGAFWRCACGVSFDQFESRGACPACARVVGPTACIDCHKVGAHGAWYPSAV